MIENWKQPVKQIIIFVMIIAALGAAGPLAKAQQPKKLPRIGYLRFIEFPETAKQIGVTIPPNVLARADKVIK